VVNESDLNHLFMLSDAFGRAGSNPVSSAVCFAVFGDLKSDMACPSDGMACVRLAFLCFWIAFIRSPLRVRVRGPTTTSSLLLCLLCLAPNAVAEGATILLLFVMGRYIQAQLRASAQSSVLNK
jgi:hypothetical protein